MAVPVHLQRPQCELGTERGRLGVHPVGTAEDGHVCELDGPAAQGLDQLAGRHTRRSAAAASATLSAVSTTSDEVNPKWIHDPSGGPIRSCTTSTNAATSWSVTRSTLVDGPHQLGVDDRRPLPARRRRAGRYHPATFLTLGRQELDLEPPGQAGLVGEQGGHVGRGVSGDHGAPPTDSECPVAVFGDVVAELHPRPAHPLGRSIGAGPGLAQGRRQGAQPEHPSARRGEAVNPAPRRAGVENAGTGHRLGQLAVGTETGDGVPGAMWSRVPFGGQHHADGGVGDETRRLRQATLRHAAQQCDRVRSQPGQHDLRLGIAEAHVVLEDLRTLGREHEPRRTGPPGTRSRRPGARPRGSTASSTRWSTVGSSISGTPE